MTSYPLPGICAIHVIACSDLPPHLMMMSDSGLILPISSFAQKVSFTGHPLFRWEHSMLNGSPQEISFLEFATTEQLPEGEPLAFVVSWGSGKQYLIGTRESNYPVVTYEETAGTVVGEPALRTYKISHKGAKSALPCIL